MRNAVHEFGQTIVMDTHDPVAASYANRIVFVGDGKITGEMVDPTTDEVIDHLKNWD
jgi:putative ABC transport system ATP-binding protein